MAGQVPLAIGVDADRARNAARLDRQPSTSANATAVNQVLAAHAPRAAPQRSHACAMATISAATRVTASGASNQDRSKVDRRRVNPPLRRSQLGSVHLLTLQWSSVNTRELLHERGIPDRSLELEIVDETIADHGAKLVEKGPLRVEVLLVGPSVGREVFCVPRVREVGEHLACAGLRSRFRFVGTSSCSDRSTECGDGHECPNATTCRHGEALGCLTT